MAGLGHLGFGFAAKPIARKVPLWLLLISTELLDMLWALFSFAGGNRNRWGIDSSIWSHSLFVSFIWSLLAALLAARIYKDKRSGLVIGILVFSHWIIDFITHPMGAVFGGAPLPPDLPLFLNDSARVGLGLYNHSFFVAILTDIGMLITGIIIYGVYRFKNRNNG